jgi:hypothetical protein
MELAAEKSPNSIVCGRALLIPNSRLINPSVSRWKRTSENVIGRDVWAIGVAGVLYRMENLNLDFLQDKTFISLAPRQDDIWFKVAAELAQAPVCFSREVGSQAIPLLCDDGLIRHNGVGALDRILTRRIGKVFAQLGMNGTPNDVAWRRVVSYATKNYRLRDSILDRFN